MMSEAHLAQLGTALLAAATPLIVVRIALAVASRPARTAGERLAPPRALVRLQHATILAVPVVGGFAVWLPARSGWMAVIEGVAFAALAAVALRALHELDDLTRAARQVESPTRVASLVARRASHYLPWSWRALPFGAAIAGLALFVWRAAGPSAVDRRLLMPVACALVAAVFLWLYETWIGGLVTGPAVAGAGDADRTRRRSIRLVFAAECILVAGFVALAHLSLDLDWSRTGAWHAIALTSGGLLGVLGCALALASDLGTRRYAVAEPDPDA